MLWEEFNNRGLFVFLRKAGMLKNARCAKLQAADMSILPAYRGNKKNSCGN